MIRLIEATIFAALLSGAANAECRFGAGEVEIAPSDLPDLVVDAVFGSEMRILEHHWEELFDPDYDPDAEPSIVYRTLTPRETAHLVASSIRVAYEDLDGDDRPEACYAIYSTRTCSQGVSICAHIVVSGDGSSTLLTAQTHILSPLYWRANRMKLVQSIDARNDGNLWSTLYRFSEGQYHADTAVPLGPLFPKDN